MFECHITIDTKDAARAVALLNDNRAKLGEWKTSEIARDPLLGDKNFFYLTTHSRDLQYITAQMNTLVAVLAGYGVSALREKIEVIIHDLRY